VAAQQRLEIVKALARAARILILDEPGAVLGPTESEELLGWLRRWVDGGGTAVLVTHKLRDALCHADAVTVLRRGRTVAAFDAREVSEEQLAEALRAGVNGVMTLGGAAPGDKTMIDALVPARDALKSALGGGATFADALRQSAAAAEQGVRDTVPLVAKKGRASYLGERSAGHQDPGATSSQLLLEAAAETWGDSEERAG
jgi:ABC-type glutathione transport system ATPase component